MGSSLWMYIIFLIILYILLVHYNTEKIVPSTIDGWVKSIDWINGGIKIDNKEEVQYDKINNNDNDNDNEYNRFSKILGDGAYLMQHSHYKNKISGRELTKEELCGDLKDDHSIVIHDYEFSSGIDFYLKRDLNSGKMVYKNIMDHYFNNKPVTYEIFDGSILDSDLNTVLIRKLLFIQHVLIHDEGFRNYVINNYPEYSLNSKLFLIYDEYQSKFNR
nr:hypothetical protein [Ganoderma leucocontextum]